MKATVEEFYKLWMRAFEERHNVPWMARQLNQTTQATYDRAIKLRARGLDLPELPRFDEYETKILNHEIAKQLGKQRAV